MYATSCPLPPTPYEIEDARYTFPGMMSSSFRLSITKRFCSAAFKPITKEDVSPVVSGTTGSATGSDEVEEDERAVDDIDIFRSGRYGIRIVHFIILVVSIYIYIIVVKSS